MTSSPVTEQAINNTRTLVKAAAKQQTLFLTAFQKLFTELREAEQEHSRKINNLLNNGVMKGTV